MKLVDITLLVLFILLVTVGVLAGVNERMYSDHRGLLCDQDFVGFIYHNGQCINTITGEFYGLGQVVCDGAWPFSPVSCVELRWEVLREATP